MHWGVEMEMEDCVRTMHCSEERQAVWGKGRSSQPQSSLCVCNEMTRVSENKDVGRAEKMRIPDTVSYSQKIKSR